MVSKYRHDNMSILCFRPSTSKEEWAATETISIVDTRSIKRFQLVINKFAYRIVRNLVIIVPVANHCLPFTLLVALCKMKVVATLKRLPVHHP